MRFDEAAADPQPESRAGRPALVAAEELGEHLRQRVLGDAFAHVAAPYTTTRRRRRRLADSSMPCGRRVLARVLDEVRDDLFELVGIGVDLRHVVGEGHLHVEVGVLHADLVDDRLGQRGEVDHLAAQHEAARLQPRDVEQFGDQARDAVGVVVHLLEHHLLLVVGEAVPAVEQQARVALDRRERRAQFVADGRHDLDTRRCCDRRGSTAPCPRRPDGR